MRRKSTSSFGVGFDVGCTTTTLRVSLPAATTTMTMTQHRIETKGQKAKHNDVVVVHFVRATERTLDRFDVLLAFDGDESLEARATDARMPTLDKLRRRRPIE